MADIQGLHLKTATAITINSICTYLKVSYLSELTDHTRMTLLPQTIARQTPMDTSFHCNLNQSTLHWPEQPPPGKKAWQQWTNMIQWLYTKPNSNVLTQPLGLLLPSHAKDFVWNWQICTHSHQLYHQTPQLHGTTIHQLHKQRPDNLPDHTMQPPNQTS